MKKIISVLVVMALLICAIPVITVGAEEEAQTPAPITTLYVGGTNALEKPQGDGWRFDSQTGVLTLNNCTLTESMVHEVLFRYSPEDDGYTERYDAMIYFTGDLTIELIGTNSVEYFVETAPETATAYHAIRAGLYETIEDGYIWHKPSKLSIRGSGNLTTGIALTEECMDEYEDIAWEHLEESFGIFCMAEGGIDLTGLQDGAWLDVYGGVKTSSWTYWNVRPWSTSPTFGAKAVVTAYVDVEGTRENEQGYTIYDSNNSYLHVAMMDSTLDANGLLTLLGSGAASGEGWIWENNVLTLYADTEVKAVEFRSGLGSAKLVLAADVTLDSTDMGYDSNWCQRGAINAYCDLQIQGGDHTLTLEGYSYPICSYLADVEIYGGHLEYAPEWGENITINGGKLTIKDATINTISGIVIYNGMDENYEDVSGGQLIVQNSVLDLGAPLVNYEDILTIQNSQVTVDGDYQGIQGIDGLVLKDSQITVDATSSTAVALESLGAVTIDNCDLHITSANIAISAGYFDEDTEADMDVLALTNMVISQPAPYQVNVAQDWSGAQFVTVLDSEGKIADTLITTGSKVGCTHSYENGVCNRCGQLESYHWTLSADTNVQLSLDEDLYVNLAGYTLSGTITTNGHQIYGADSATNGYTCDNMGYFSCTEENGNAIVPENSDQYLTIATEAGYTFHHFYVGITHMSLAPNVTGFGYKAAFYCDEMVQQQIDSIGYQLWLTEDLVINRTADFKDSLTLRLKNFDVTNYGETPVSAKACINLKDGKMLTSGVTAVSMRKVLETINADYTSLSAQQLSAVKAMIEKYSIIQSWNVNNLFA